MKGFLLSIAILGGVFYFLNEGSSSSDAGKVYASATGAAVEVTPSNADYMVAHAEAPVIAYFWAPW
ncbi:MAG: thioredoxin-like negative regulator of GroEL [Verrucomicrobiales bacterium]|jgi:thioredoxin-like negative regulator of GroEL